MNIVDVPIDEVSPHPLNPRRGAVAAIVRSIEVNGFYGFIVVQGSTGYILKRNHTWRALKRIGYKTVPVHFLDVDNEKAEEILLLDNKTSDEGTYDEKSLLAILDIHQQKTGSVENTGYEEDDLLRLHRKHTSETPKKPKRTRQVCPSCGHRF
jgi:ParB-like chromosome segregation protein Spo0J